MKLKEFDQATVCSECGGPAFSDLVLAEKKDACYSKVRSRYKVWPSAYASGALVQCRKKGAANWGNKSKNESLTEFAPGGGNIPRGPKTPRRGPWDDSGEDPYQLRRYNRSIDFFDQFDSDGVDKQNYDKATGEYEGYYFDRDAASGITQIAYFKFDDPTKIGDNDPGIGWYYEPVDEGVAEGNVVSLDKHRPTEMSAEFVNWLRTNHPQLTMQDLKNPEIRNRLYREFRQQDISEDHGQPNFDIDSHDNFKTAFEVTLTIDNKYVGFFSYQYFPETNDVENDANVREGEFRGQGYGKMLLLKAIATAQKHGLPFKVDRNGVTSAQGNVYRSLMRDGFIKLNPDRTITLTGRSVDEQQLAEKCWDTHRQAGMKKKGNRMVPNCVPKESKDVMENNRQIYNQVYQIMVRGAPEFMKQADSADVKRAIVKAMSFGDQISAQDLASYAYGMLKSNSIDEDLSRRGFLRGLGAAAVGAAGLGAAGTAQARATPEWLEKVSQAKELFNKGLTPEQVAKKLGVSGPNNNMAGPMGGDWGAINYAYREVQRSRGTGMNEEYNPEYDDEAGMADNNLQTLARAVQGIDDLIDSGDNLPEWCQEKIANAKSMLVAVWDYMRSEEDREEDPEDVAMYEAIDTMARALAKKYNVSLDEAWESFEALPDHVLYETAQFRLQMLTEDWQKVNKQDRTDGMSRRAVKAYRRENPGSKLKTAVTTKPSKLKKGGKAAKRRKSFCARMRGMKKSRASAKTKRNPNSPINKALRRWNC